MSLFPLQASFVRGELSPRLHAAAHLDLYRAGLSVCLNFITLPHGGLRKRGGTYFINEAKDSTHLTIGIPFIFDDEQAYFLEVGPEYFRVYAYSAQVLDAGDPVEVTTDYSVDDLKAIRYVQSADVMWLAVRTVAPQKLTREDHTVWTIEDKTFDDGPFGAQNIDEDISLWVSDIEGDITISANADYFTEDMIGRLIMIEMESYEDISPWEAAGIVHGDNNIPTGLVRRYEGNVYECVTLPADHVGEDGIISDGSGGYKMDDDVRSGGTPPTHEKVGEVEKDGVVEEDANYYGNGQGAWVGLEWLYLHSGFGIARITDVSDSMAAAATVLSRFPDEIAGGEESSSTIFSLGSYADGDWPDTVTLYEERLGFSQRFTVDLSKTGDFDSFKLGEKDDDALQFLNSGVGGANQIVWMADGDGFLVEGTIGGIRSLSGSGIDEALTPSSFKNRHSRTYGCAPIAPVDTGTAFLYVCKSRQMLAEMTMGQNMRFQAQDIGQINEHIPKRGIRNLAFQNYPDPIAWFPLDTGELGGLTYQPSQEVRGMHRHQIGGFPADLGWAKVEWATVTPGFEGGNDDVWLNVRRGVGESLFRSIEVMQNPLEYGDIEDAFYVDCGLTYDGTAKNDFDGLEHLALRQVYILADGVVYTTEVSGNPIVVDADGTCAIPGGAEASKVHIGLPFPALATTLEIDVGSKDGSLLGRNKRVSKVIVSVLETDILGFEISAHAVERWEKVNIVTLRPDDPGDALPSNDPSAKRKLFSGSFEIPIDDTWNGQGKISIKHTSPTPCTIRGITPVFDAEP